MKIDLPLENWTDFFKLVPRQQLIQLFPQINDRDFASFLQYYLKKFVALDELDKLHITTNWNGPIIVKKDGEWELPLTDVPMPPHIKNFKEIEISYFDRSVLDFLAEFHRNSLFTNVNIKMSSKDITSPENRLEFLTHFVSLVNNINSIELVANSLYLGLFQNEYSEMFVTMLASARVLITNDLLSYYNSRDDWFFRWLYTPRADAIPRVLVYKRGLTSFFVQRIKMNFLEAKQSISFSIINAPINELGSGMNLSTLDNNQTNERLVIIDYWNDIVLIYRYPIGASQAWIEEMANYQEYNEYRNIIIDI